LRLGGLFLALQPNRKVSKDLRKGCKDFLKVRWFFADMKEMFIFRELTKYEKP
jgi:hypothetical protein